MNPQILRPTNPKADCPPSHFKISSRVGKEVEVRGQVVSVTTSPLGTAFINFGRDYPNQTFAGFIAAGSPIAADRRLTMIQGKTISITGIVQLRDGKPEIEIL